MSHLAISSDFEGCLWFWCKEFAYTDGKAGWALHTTFEDDDLLRELVVWHSYLSFSGLEPYFPATRKRKRFQLVKAKSRGNKELRNNKNLGNLCRMLAFHGRFFAYFFIGSWSSVQMDLFPVSKISKRGAWDGSKQRQKMDMLMALNTEKLRAAVTVIVTFGI